MPDSANRVSMVFIGQRNFYTEFLTEWLAGLTDLKGIVWTASQRKQRRAKWRRLRGRITRFGLVRALSEVLFYVGITPHRRTDEAALRQMIEEARKTLVPVRPGLPEALEVPDLRGDEVRRYLEARRADLVLTQCINERIPESVYTIPRLGCFVYHEGIVPKYRGKFCTHWAILNREYDQIGASLVRVEAGMDTGQVAFTCPVRPHGQGYRHQWWEHEVLFLALPRLKQWIQEVAAGHLPLKDQEARYPIYSYPLFRHLLKMGRRVRQYEKWLAQHGGPGA
jgi:hypothetical protein